MSDRCATPGAPCKTWSWEMPISSRLMRPGTNQLLMQVFQHEGNGARAGRKKQSPALPAVCMIAVCLASLTARPCFARTPEPVRLRRGEIVLTVEQRPNGNRFLKAKILLDAPLPVVW